MNLKDCIIYEDQDILALNKPSGVVVHSDGRTKEPNVSEWLLSYFPEVLHVGEPITLSSGNKIERPGIVHRIDRETSGILLLAKTERGFSCLKEQFQGREIEKTYIAFVHGNLKEDHGSINLPIGRSPSDFRKWSAERGARGEKREALTYFRVLARGNGGTLIEAKPKTGRTHQIRVHFKALQHPIVADSLYAPSKEKLFGFTRLALHAREVRFKDAEGNMQSLSAPYPEDFEEGFRQIGYAPAVLP